MEVKKQIFDLHQELQIWKKQLAFYKDEIAIMKNRLDQVAERNTKIDILSKVSHFENKILIQKDEMDKLLHEFNIEGGAIESNIVANPIASDHRTMEDHGDLREKMQTYEQIFEELRDEFTEFLRKTL